MNEYIKKCDTTKGVEGCGPDPIHSRMPMKLSPPSPRSYVEYAHTTTYLYQGRVSKTVLWALTSGGRT